MPHSPEPHATDQYRELFERSADAVLILDNERFIDCNQATVDMLRFPSREAVLQTHPSELSPEVQPDGLSSFEKANDMMATALKNGSHRFEWTHRRANGEEFPVEVLLTAMPRGGRTILHTVWRDITERKRLETELRQAQKMEAIGRLTGAIAHDFNNLLMAITGHAELLKMSLETETELMDHTDQILRAGDRAASLVKQLLTFSRKQVMQPKVLNLHRVFTDLEQMMKRLLGEGIKIETRFCADPLWIKVDPGQLEQVIINLATNARDAMPDGGTLSFATALVELTEDGNVLSAGRYVTFSVADTGTGMSAATKANMFEPFFTTKDRDKGTGLGLSTVYGITRRIGGDVTVQTEEGVGSVFQVYLPESTEAPAIESSKPEMVPATIAKSEVILVVEDDDAVTNVLKSVLQGNGYTVHTADDGENALQLIANQNLKFDLLLTDVVMPRMSGPELVARLRGTLPQLKVLYISGYTSSSLTDFGNIKEGINLIHKPVSAQDLLTRLRMMLDEETNI